VTRLKAFFATWQTRDLGGERYAVLMLDGFHLKVRLLTFYEFPKTMWKSLRTTNTLENLNREFRRRTKTQASFGTEAAALTLLYGLVAFGQIVLRRIDGHERFPAFLAKEWSQAA
jgi:transposase-like protein